MDRLCIASFDFPRSLSAFCPSPRTGRPPCRRARSRRSSIRTSTSSRGAHPSIAAGNGIHDHDDRLDDFSPAGIAAEIAALKGERASPPRIDTRR